MKTSIRYLLDLAGSAEGNNRQINWADVEANLGHSLPADYRRLTAEVHAGCFDDFVWLLAPENPNPHLDLLTQRTRQLEAAVQFSAAGGALPFERPWETLLPAAITDNGDVIYWRMDSSADPDAWGLVLNETRDGVWVQVDQTLTAFLHAALTGTRTYEIFPDDFPSADPGFARA